MQFYWKALVETLCLHPKVESQKMDVVEQHWGPECKYIGSLTFLFLTVIILNSDEFTSVTVNLKIIHTYEELCFS